MSNDIGVDAWIDSQFRENEKEEEYWNLQERIKELKELIRNKEQELEEAEFLGHLSAAELLAGEIEDWQTELNQLTYGEE